MREPLGEIRFAIRRLRRDAGSTIAAVAALACAIGAAVATWSLLSAVLLKRRPRPHAARGVTLRYCASRE
jgi:hypothetical protein